MDNFTPPSEDPTQRSPRIAANPIPYWYRDGKADKSKEVFDQAFADFADIGFTAVKADVPEGMSATEYADWINSSGLAPSLSLFGSPFDETIDIAEEVERAKRFAADQVALGLDRTMVSSMAIPARIAQPAVGADFDKDRFALALENCGIICQVMQRKVCARCTTPMSVMSSKPRTKSCICWTRLAPTSSGPAPTLDICGGQALTPPPLSDATPTGSVASTSRTASLTISIQQLGREWVTTSSPPPSGSGPNRGMA